MNFTKEILAFIAPLRIQFVLTVMLSCLVNVCDFIFLFSLVKMLSSFLDASLGSSEQNFHSISYPMIAAISYFLRSVLHPVILFRTNFIATKSCTISRRKSIENLFVLSNWQLEEIALGKFLDHYTRKYWILANAILPSIIRLFSDAIFVLILVTYLLIENILVLVSLTVIGILSVFIVRVIQNKLKLRGEKLDEKSKQLVSTFSVTHSSFAGILTSSSPSFIFNRLNNDQSELFNLMRETMNIAALPKFFIETLLFLIILMAITQSNFLIDNGYAVEVGIIGLAAVRLIPIAINLSNLVGLVNLYSNLVEEIIAFEKNLVKEVENHNTSGNSKPVVEKLDKNISVIIRDLKISFLPKLNKGTAINLDLEKGKLLYISGRSGSGKSSLLKCISGLENRYVGTIKINKELQLPQEESICEYVTQSPYILNASMFENIVLKHKSEYSRADLDFISERCRAILVDLGLSHILNYLEEEIDLCLVPLSGGEKQRIHLARSLMFPKQVILFDEITSSVDAETEQLMLNAIDKYAKKSTHVFVGHNAKLIKKNYDVLNL